jgi:hypothetical protein
LDLTAGHDRGWPPAELLTGYHDAVYEQTVR